MLLSLALILLAGMAEVGGQTGDAGLTEIILDCVQDYFYGDRSAQEAAALIQQKATIYVSEHK